MGRVMAFDYGTKRIGVAVSDPTGTIAGGLSTLHPKDIMAWLSSYLSKEQVSCFVVGEPLDDQGRESAVTPHIKGFIKQLRKQFPEIPIKRMQERYTSVMAQKSMIQAGLNKKKRQNKALVDEVSATLILQDWLQYNPKV